MFKVVLAVLLGVMASRRVRRRIQPELPPAGCGPERPHEDFDQYSCLGSHLLTKWAWGGIPACDVQTAAKAALRDRSCNTNSAITITPQAP